MNEINHLKVILEILFRTTAEMNDFLNAMTLFHM